MTRTRPTDAPSGGPSGTGNRGNGFGRGGVTGVVLSVSGATFVVQPETRQARQGSTAPTSATTAAATETVNTTAATTYTALTSATAADLTVGRCVTALGTADQTGAVTAASIVVRDPVDGSCAGAQRAPSATRSGA